jgi:hypothetical protein
MSDKIAKLKTMLELLQNDTITPQELTKFLAAVVGAVNQAKIDLKSLSKENLDTIKASVALIAKERLALLSEVDEKNSKASTKFDVQLAEVRTLLEEVKAIEVKDGEDGKDADEELVVETVLARIPKPEEMSGESIVDKINDLSVDPENQIDAAHIKNLPEMARQMVGGVVARNIYQMGDVVLDSLTDGDALVWVAANNRWENGAGAGGGAVDSVNGQTGVVVLDTGDLAESGNLFFTDERAQDAIGAMVGDTDTIDLTYTDVTPLLKADVRVQMSITSDASGLKLVGDAATPGNSKYYGTNGSGTKGFYDVPGGGTGITRTITSSAGAFTAGSTAGVDYVYLITGAHAVALPTAVGNTNRYTFKNNHSAAITITPDGVETVEGGATLSLNPLASVDLISNNSVWFVI